MNSTQKIIEISCDFETTTVEPTEVWLAGIYTDNDLFIWTTCIKDFLDEIAKLITTTFEKKSCRISFFNLNFDGEFLVDWMLRNGFEAMERESHMYRDTFYIVRAPIAGFISIAINYNDVIIRIYDSYKRLSGSIAVHGKILGIEKGETPLLAEKPAVIEQEWIDYLKRDCEIAYKAIMKQNNMGMIKTTTPSNALHTWKMLKNFNRGDFVKKYPHEYFMNRSSYRGGFCYKHHKKGPDVITSKLYYYDYNSHYPAIMLANRMPYGYPKCSKFYVYEDIVDIVANGEMLIIDVYIKFTVKDEYPASVLINGLYPREFVGFLSLHHADFMRLVSHSDCEYEIANVKRYKTEPDVFTDYVNMWQKEKQQAIRGTPDGDFRYFVAKLMQNGLYGKFGSNPLTTNSIPYLDDGILRYRYVKALKASVYIPIAIHITALARDKIISDILANGYDNFEYCDTDSIITSKEMPPELVDPKKLGFLKLEAELQKTQIVGQKRYKFITSEGEHVIKCVGIRLDKYRKFDDCDLLYGEYKMKQMSRVRGGRIMKEVSKKLYYGDKKRAKKENTRTYKKTVDVVREP